MLFDCYSRGGRTFPQQQRFQRLLVGKVALRKELLVVDPSCCYFSARGSAAAVGALQGVFNGALERPRAGVCSADA